MSYVFSVEYGYTVHVINLKWLYSVVSGWRTEQPAPLLFSVVLPSAYLKVLQTFSISTRTGQFVDTVSLEVKLASIEGGKVRISAGSAGFKADRVTILDSVHNIAFLPRATPNLLTFHILCCSITHTLLLTL